MASRGRFLKAARSEPVSTGFSAVDWNTDNAKSVVKMPSRGISRGAMMVLVYRRSCL